MSVRITAFGMEIITSNEVNSANDLRSVPKDRAFVLPHTYIEARSAISLKKIRKSISIRREFNKGTLFLK